MPGDKRTEDYITGRFDNEKDVDEQLMQLNREMISMGALCENVIAMAAKSLLETDMELARKVALTDAETTRRSGRSSPSA